MTHCMAMLRQLRFRSLSTPRQTCPQSRLLIYARLTVSDCWYCSCVTLIADARMADLTPEAAVADLAKGCRCEAFEQAAQEHSQWEMHLQGQLPYDCQAGHAVHAMFAVPEYFPVSNHA